MFLSVGCIAPCVKTPKGDFEGNKLTSKGKLKTAAIIADFAIIFFTLIAGNLCLNLYPMHWVAAYSLIGIGTTILMIWVALALLTQGIVVLYADGLLRESFSCHPRDRFSQIDLT